jgi:hypothetical protein
VEVGGIVAVSPDGASVYTVGLFSVAILDRELPPPPPTSKEQCKNAGWKDFPDFKNQGQCVAFVQRGPGPGEANGRDSVPSARPFRGVQAEGVQAAGLSE